MKKERKLTNSMKAKVTRQYTCTRRINKEGKKIWVVLEDGRKFYRIFKVRTKAITYFRTLKTIYAEMLVQDLVENVFTSVVYTKLETIKKGLIQDMEVIAGSIVEDSDKLFDEDELFMDDIKFDEPIVAEEKKGEIKSKNNSSNNPVVASYDFSFVDDMFPKPQPLIKPINIPFPSDNGANKLPKSKVVSEEYGIKIYKSDIDLSYYLLGEEFYKNQEKIVEEKE